MPTFYFAFISFEFASLIRERGNTIPTEVNLTFDP